MHSECPHDVHVSAAAKEFTPVKDTQDGYSFVYPFGWQEVAVKGQDIVYKDVIEPLESVSVSITQTDKANVAEFGSPAEVRPTPSNHIVNNFIISLYQAHIWLF